MRLGPEQVHAFAGISTSSSAPAAVPIQTLSPRTTNGRGRCTLFFKAPIAQIQSTASISVHLRFLRLWRERENLVSPLSLDQKNTWGESGPFVELTFSCTRYVPLYADRFL